jgi:leader peptidase (prepilin peptidase) / N-methyltransferase
MVPLGISDWYLIGAGLPIGSFVGLVVDRLPQGETIAKGRSRCARCDARLTVRDLVPLVSWLASGGRCRHCGLRIGWFYPAVEVAALVVAVLAVSAARGAEAWIDAGFGWWLLALGWIDWRHTILPDVLTLPLIPLGLVVAGGLERENLLNLLLGAVAGFFGLWLVARVYRRMRGREGLGLGDAKLLAGAGTWVGMSGLPSVLAGASLGGLIAAGGMVLAGHRLDRHSALPFGPFLSAATWLIWLFGPIRF